MISMQNATAFHIPAQAGFVLLAAEPTEDIHHGAFAGFVKGAQGDVLGLGQQGFGFSHFGIPVLDTDSLNKTSFRGIPFNLNGVEAA